MLSGLPNRHFDLVLINSDCQTIKQSDILNYFFFSESEISEGQEGGRKHCL